MRSLLVLVERVGVLQLEVDALIAMDYPSSSTSSS